MKKLITIIMMLIMLITAGPFPQVAYGINEEDLTLLTPEEQAFHTAVLNQSTDILNILQDYGDVLDRDYNNAQDINYGYGMLPKKSVVCGIQSAPAIFEPIRQEWNGEICPSFTAFRSKVSSCFEEAMENPEWTITRTRLNECIRKLKPECKRIQQEASDVYGRSLNIEQELVDRRKEVREKAKPLIKEGKDIIKKDTENRNNDNQNQDKNNKDSDDILDTSCFIATAAYGSPDAAEIDILRRFRDEFLLHNYPGKTFVAVYYATSPPVADFISGHEVLRLAVREGFVAPVVMLVELTESWWLK